MRPNESHTLSREELYEKVWSTPLRHLAGEYGLSDVGLAKLCKRHRIPSPPVGYWVKRQHGKADPRPPLPDLTDQSLGTVTIESRPSAPSAPMPERRTRVPTVLRDPHPLVAEAIQRQDRRQTNPEGILVAYVKDRHLHLSVSPASFPRATRLIDTLLKLLESSGHRVALPRDGKGTFIATVEGQSLTIYVREQLRQEKVQETYGERTLLKPTGRLEILIDEWLDGARKRWGDGKKRAKLEDQLDRFHHGLRVAAEAKRLHEERLAAQRAHWEAEQQRRQEAAERRLREQQRAEDLDRQATNWQRSQLIRTYLNAVETTAIERHGRIHPESELGQWISWGRNYAERLDPLSNLRERKSDQAPPGEDSESR